MLLETFCCSFETLQWTEKSIIYSVLLFSFSFFAQVSGCLGCSDHEMVKFKTLRAERRMCSELTTLYFRRADFDLFRNLLDRVLWDKHLDGRGKPESWLIFKDGLLQVQEQCIPTKRNSGKNARRPLWMFLDKLKHTHKKSLQMVEAKIGSLGGIQKNCLNSWRSS